jgi:glycosyltransferase involved in cell wall biosynthesis
VVDGSSSDDSVEVIRRFATLMGERLKWVSEPDSGIYNAMNKGIGMADGDYLQILNSGDMLASEDVTERMLAELEKHGFPAMLYGNMIKCFSDGHKVLDRSFEGKPITMLGMYTGTLNHNPTYIRRDLFEKYGNYDEKLRIVSDWKWFLNAIILGGEEPVYANVNVSLFDMNGVSETNAELVKKERNAVLESLLPKALLADYEGHSFMIGQIIRIKRHPLIYRIVWLLERFLFKIEKSANRRKNRIR